MGADSYADIPYDSTPFPEARPDHLHALARLHGLDPAVPAKARVLELGCASGGHLIPLAHRFPEGRFTGIELSAAQVAAGRRVIEAAGLRNVELHAADLTAPGTVSGEYDYIVALGLYSWVPPAVQARVLEVCARHLAPQGVALLSFNTLPGWRSRARLRDLLFDAVRGIGDPPARLAQAQATLAQFEGALEGLDALSARQARLDIQRVRSAHPAYLYHEYLEDRNEALLFRDFAARAAAAGLAWLCEADLHTQYPFSLGEAAIAWVSGAEDPIGQQQRLDFVLDRNLRKSLLCRADVPRIDEPDGAALTALAFHAVLLPPKKLDLAARRPAPFRAPDGSTVEVAHPLTRAAVAHLAGACPDAVGWEALLETAVSLARQARAPLDDAAPAHLLAELFSLCAQGAVGMSAAPAALRPGVAERPRLDRLARAHLDCGLEHFATVHHGTLRLEPETRRWVALLDGTRTLAECIEQAMPGLDQRPRAKAIEHGNAVLGLLARHGLLAG